VSLNDSVQEEVVRLRRCLSDLMGIMALPTLWEGGEPVRIADVLDALMGMLPLVFCHMLWMCSADR
jgi:hypothetical protein